MKAIIIDDENAAREATTLMIETFCPQIDVLSTLSGVDDAVAFLDANQVDLIFLDIEMPKKNGFALFREIDCSPYQVIMTTGHNEYAIKAFKYAACHYLLKPLIPAELMHACSLAEERNRLKVDKEKLQILESTFNKKVAYPDTIVVNTTTGYEIVQVATIIRFEGDRNYSWLYQQGNKILTSKTLKDFEEILDPKQFYRVHKSHLVNLQFLQKISNKGAGAVVLSDGTEIALSRHRKRDFISWLEQKK